jgi:hypothetical protein
LKENIISNNEETSLIKVDAKVLKANTLDQVCTNGGSNNQTQLIKFLKKLETVLIIELLKSKGIIDFFKEGDFQGYDKTVKTKLESIHKALIKNDKTALTNALKCLNFFENDSGMKFVKKNGDPSDDITNEAKNSLLNTLFTIAGLDTTGIFGEVNLSPKIFLDVINIDGGNVTRNDDNIQTELLNPGNKEEKNSKEISEHVLVKAQGYILKLGKYYAESQYLSLSENNKDNDGIAFNTTVYDKDIQRNIPEMFQ